MVIQSLSFRFAVAISFSFAAASYATAKTPYSADFFTLKSHSSPATPPAPKATPSDLLSLLGSPQQASSVNPIVAKELRSCFNFLVPFSPSQLGPESETTFSRRALSSKSRCSDGNRRRREENELVWWPPAPVMELARLAVDSGGDPDAISGTLDPTMIPVPDIEESNENKCHLTRTPYGRHFINKGLMWFIMS